MNQRLKWFKKHLIILCCLHHHPGHSADEISDHLSPHLQTKARQTALSIRLQKAMSGKNAQALYRLSEMYRNGTGCEQNTQRADFFAEHYLKLKGNGSDLLALAGIYNTQDDGNPVHPKIDQYLILADQYFETHGAVNDWEELSFLFRGDGILPKDPGRVQKYFELAEPGLVATRNPEALCTLAWAYLNDDIIPKNVSKALGYLESAADLGSWEACIHLSNLYWMGEICPKDYKKFFYYIGLGERLRPLDLPQSPSQESSSE